MEPFGCSEYLKLAERESQNELSSMEESASHFIDKEDGLTSLREKERVCVF